MRQFPLARVRPDGSVGFGSVHRRAELWRGQRAGLHYDAERHGEVPQGVGAILNWTDFCNNIVPTGKKLGEDFPIKSFYASCTNVVSNQTDQNKTLELMNAIGVHRHPGYDYERYRAVCRYPAARLPLDFETEDLRVRYYCNPYLLWNEKAVEPLYESKPDFEIYKLIAEAMGYGDFFQFTADEYLNVVPLHPLWAGKGDHHRQDSREELPAL